MDSKELGMELAAPILREYIDPLGGQRTEVLSTGLTKRELFAAMANTALIQAFAARYMQPGYSDTQMIYEAAYQAIKSADELLAKLSKPKEDDHDRS
jgi:hypothetical protein